jgi:rhamnose utilization protein RhaD (predicted bifunctional aldolase and dehydrogenase)
VSRNERTRAQTKELYPALCQFFGCYLHEDWPLDSGTPEKAVDQAIADYPLNYRQQVRRELNSFLERHEDDTRFRAILNEGLGVNVLFKKAAEARLFAQEVERRLLDSIKAETSGKWST